VIAGDERFEGEYARRLREIADPRVIFPGYISGGKLDELYAHCRFYVLPSLVEGLPISLIEAMSFSKPVLISDIPENLEVAGGVARTFARGNRSDLARALKEMIELGEDEKTAMGKKGRERVIGEYDWDRITDSTESLYLDLMPRVR
jgi:glycosyltransferase involved in cell wall biosynthesis